jgi:hypothetical protein
MNEAPDIGEGWCQRRQSNERGGGICDEKVGFACSLAVRAGPSPLFSRPESPSAPQGAGDGLGSLDGLRAYSGGKRGTGGAAGPNNTVRMKKNACRGPSRGDGWRCSKELTVEPSSAW